MDMQQAVKENRVSIYDQVGGAEGVAVLVNKFYDLIESSEEGRPVYLMHLRGHGLPHARMEQVNFLSGLFGGPKLYTEKWGHSNIRQIHEHVEINEEGSESWLTCMAMTLDELDYPEALKQTLMKSFNDMAAILVSQSDALHH